MLAARDAVAAVRGSLLAQVDALVALVEQHRDTPMVARTLTQHAVPTTFGLKAAGWLAGVLDAHDELAGLGFPVQLGGAAGTMAAVVELGGVEATRGCYTATVEALGLGKDCRPGTPGARRSPGSATRPSAAPTAGGGSPTTC